MNYPNPNENEYEDYRHYMEAIYEEAPFPDLDEDEDDDEELEAPKVLGE